jgi:hypothetical protein
VVAGVAAAVMAGVLTPAGAGHAQSATAAAPPFVATGHSPTQGTPLPGGYLTADLGTWTSPPQSYDFQWLRDGVAIPGATERDYLVQTGDIGHQLAPHVYGHSGGATAEFVGTSMTARKIGSSLSLDVRRVHPAPGKQRLVWMAISFVSTERPWSTDGGTVTAYKKKHGRLAPLGSATVVRGAAFVRMPWKQAPQRRKVLVCFEGSDAVAVGCSPVEIVRRGPDG